MPFEEDETADELTVIHTFFSSNPFPELLVPHLEYDRLIVFREVEGKDVGVH